MAFDKGFFFFFLGISALFFIKFYFGEGGGGEEGWRQWERGGEEVCKIHRQVSK